jgi:MGT family glycosyltransferase
MPCAIQTLHSKERVDYMHISYVSVGATGHVLASLTLVTELVKRGVRVTYFTSENFRAMVETTGAAFSPVTTSLTNQGKADKDVAKNMDAELPLRFLSEGAGAVEQLLTVMRCDMPQAVISDTLAIAGRLAASALKLPLIQVFTSYASNQFFDVSANLPQVPDTDPARVAASALADELSIRYGTEHFGMREIFGGSKCGLNIVTVQKDFQPAGDTFDDTFVFAGAQIAKRVGSTWTPPAEDLPIVYSSLGTLFNNWPEFYIMLGQAVKDLPVQVIASIGSNILPEALGELPANMQVQAFLPQLDILERASLFLTHAGIGSVMEAVYYGVPMLAMPQMGEQVLTAIRMQKLGLGEAIIDKRQVTAALLRDRIQHMLSDKALRSRVQIMREKMLSGDSAATAAQRVIDYIAQQ